MEGLMGQPYVGEIRMFGGNFAPAGWAFCNGQLLPISENETLFNLIGTTYGGDGQSTFALPDLQSRVPVHQGNGYVLAETGGVEEVTLTTAQVPAHSHPLVVSTTAASSRSAVGGIPAAAPSDVAWTSAAADEGMSQTSAAGGSQPHTNMQPYLGISFIISLFGVFPSQT
ncbi:microcystin-dependent protein [Nocardioides sp. BE266]|uniref:phage tail protein n=1 Tax=Nocardioides sp. BE266 TaxID=2817725 RepID=UPI002859D034|nr:tail fiber protein [Nocardioides sp. BE266]MDR7252490.1 microcystin-dependent protein [Nocardioides sp. BE266]